MYTRQKRSEKSDIILASRMSFSAKPALVNLLISSALGLAALFVNLFAEPWKRGFYCDDEVI